MEQNKLERIFLKEGKIVNAKGIEVNGIPIGYPRGLSSDQSEEEISEEIKLGKTFSLFNEDLVESNAYILSNPEYSPGARIPERPEEFEPSFHYEIRFYKIQK